MTWSVPSVVYPARSTVASFVAAAAFLTAGIPGASAAASPSATVPAPSADGGRPTGITSLSTGWDKPSAISFLPDGIAALVTERDTARVFRLGSDGARQRIGEVPHTVAPAAGLRGGGGLLGVAPSPTWNGTTDKRVFFVHSTSRETRVARMTYDGRSLSDYRKVLGGIKRGDGHNGGKIAFGPDGYLYVSTGDAERPELAQDTNSLNGKILRIATTGAPAPGNPFGNPVYSYGHRDPQGLAWDRDDRLWSAEMGEDASDELNLIKAGGNYGWPACEGRCDLAGMTDPKQTWTPQQGVPAQLAVVRNVLYVSSLRGRQLWRIPIDGHSERVGAKTGFYGGVYGRLRALAKVPGADELWLATSDRGAGHDEFLRVTIK